MAKGGEGRWRRTAGASGWPSVERTVGAACNGSRAIGKGCWGVAEGWRVRRGMFHVKHLPRDVRVGKLGELQGGNGMAKAKKPRLGRGLSSLMSQPVAVSPPAAATDPADPTGDGVEVGGADAAESAPGSPAAGGAADLEAGSSSDGGNASGVSADGGIQYLAIDAIEPNPHQPRQRMAPGPLRRLAESIRQDGVMQPIVVRPAEAAGAYELVAGERRWRAAQEAGLDTLPAIVRELSDRQLAEWALVENLQREDLDAIEKARAFERVVETFHVKHDELASRLGIDRSTLANTLRLLELPEPIQRAVRDQHLAAGHARALLALPDDEARIALAERAIAGGWSVRMVEAAVKRAASAAAPSPERPVAQRPAHLADLEAQIAQQLNTKVQLKSGRKKGSGALTLHFYSLDEFDALLDKLGVHLD